MHNSRFFYLYFVGGLLALGLLIYNVAVNYPQVKTTSIAAEVILSALLLYLANKTYHEKKDKEMM